MFYRIGDFAKKVGLSRSTLRKWEEKGIIKPHHISPTGYRYYSDEQVAEITNSGGLVKGGNDNGRAREVSGNT